MIVRMDDEWRVEVDLDDEEHGYSLGERLRAHDLDDEARARLGGRVVVTRNGPRLFLYAASEERAHEAERIVRELVAAEELTAELALTRWHPMEGDWKEAAIPLPRTAAEEREERLHLEESERVEAAEEGSHDWWVKVELRGRGDAAEQAEKLRSQGLVVHRRWRYLTIEVLTEEAANELAGHLRPPLTADATIYIEANPDDLANPVFVLLGSRFDRSQRPGS